MAFANKRMLFVAFVAQECSLRFLVSVNPFPLQHFRMLLAARCCFEMNCISLISRTKAGFLCSLLPFLGFDSCFHLIYVHNKIWNHGVICCYFGYFRHYTPVALLLCCDNIKDWSITYLFFLKPGLKLQSFPSNKRIYTPFDDRTARFGFL